MAKYPKGRRRTVSPKPKGKSSRLEDPSCYLLRILLAARPDYVSGTVLAERLKMTRVAIWGRIDKLRSQGLDIEAARNRGYRLEAEPDHFNQYLLEAWLRDKGVVCPSYVFDSLDSTSSEAERQLAGGKRGSFAVISSSQEKGRGRLGRKWHSPSAGNLYLSVAFRPKMPALRLRLLTLWLATRLCNHLRSLSGIDIMVKWPNDLVVNGRKVGGMLTEASIDTEHVRTLVFGLGLNVNAARNRFPKALKDTASSLRSEAGRGFHLHELTAETIDIILKGYKECLDKLDSKTLKRYWNPLDALKGKQVIAKSGKEIVKGKASGIDDSGALLIKLRNGRIRAHSSGDVTLNAKND
jgi:BirA family transcriptional regulator, biotin operon repressor / biotin---[acetyl-CoA-carboxylase] ligase